MAMQKKPRIGIVGGNLTHPRSVDVFSHLTQLYDIAFFVIDHSNLVDNYRGSIPLHVFENLKDMPGYMRALEEYISDFDILVGFESSRLSTFQMVRVAKKQQIPTAVIVNEFHPYFYQNYPNIRAIQVDVLENATRFWPSSRLAESMLKVESVSSDRIARMQPAINVSAFHPNRSKRQKFRSHIGADENSILILAHRELEPWTYPEDLLHGFRLLYVTNPNLASRLKLLFVGDGSLARDLKYRCYDLNLGNSVVFIHQASAAFASDMYAASDFVFCPRRHRDDFHEDFPLNDLEAIASGAVPIFKMGTLISEFCSDSGIPLSDVNFQTIADGLAGVLNKPGGIKRASEKAVDTILKGCTPEKVSSWLAKEIDELLEVSNGMKVASQSSAERAELLLENIRQGKVSEPLIQIEEFLLEQGLRADVRSELLTEKGLELSRKGDLEQSFEALHDAVKLCESNTAAYRGLGYLSLKSHSHDEAISFFKKALARNDKDVESMFGVGMVHRRLGLNEEALYWFERCMLVEANNQKIKSALSQTCLECRSPAKAIASLERIQSQIGEEASLLLTLGQLYLKEGRAELGNELVSRALDMQENKVLKSAG